MLFIFTQNISCLCNKGSIFAVDHQLNKSQRWSFGFLSRSGPQSAKDKSEEAVLFGSFLPEIHIRIGVDLNHKPQRTYSSFYLSNMRINLFAENHKHFFHL